MPGRHRPRERQMRTPRSPSSCQRAQAQDVRRSLLGAGAGAIAVGESVDVGQAEARRPRRADRGDQLRFDRRRPAADHLDQRRVERFGVGQLGRRIDRHGEADQRQLAFAKLDRPAADRRFDRHSRASPQWPCGAPWSARRAAARRRRRDGGEARPASSSSRGRGRSASDIAVSAAARTSASSNEISRSCGSVDTAWAQRLAGVARRREAELAVQLRQPLAQHRHLLGRRAQRRAGPQPGVQRQQSVGTLDHDHVERDAAMDRRNAVGLEDQDGRASRRTNARSPPWPRPRSTSAVPCLRMPSGLAIRPSASTSAWPSKREIIRRQPAQQLGSLGSSRSLSASASSFISGEHLGASRRRPRGRRRAPAGVRGPAPAALARRRGRARCR